MREITISKVKLIDGGESGVEIQFQEDALIKSNDDKECENPVHEDFKKAVQGLAVHLAVLTDYIQEKKSGDSDEIEKFTVTGYSVRGADEKRGFVVTGYRTTRRGGTVVLNSPFTRFEEDEATAYSLVGDVEAKIKKIEEEGKQYLFKGKQAPKQQLSLEMPGDEPVTNIKIAKPQKSSAESEKDFDLGDLIEEEYVAAYKSSTSTKIPTADKDAMARVAAESNEELNGGRKKKNSSKK